MTNDLSLNYWTWQKREKNEKKLFYEKFDWFSAFVVVSIISLIWKKIFLPLDERSFLSFSPKNVIFSLTSIRHVVANLKFVSEDISISIFKILQTNILLAFCYKDLIVWLQVLHNSKLERYSLLLWYTSWNVYYMERLGG